MARRGKPYRGLVEDTIKLDATDMRRLGVLRTGAFGRLTWDLTWGKSQSQVAEARYRTSETELIFDFKDEDRAFRQSVRIVQQECHLGGYRKWFLCPYRGPDGLCFRRVRCLYVPSWGNQFGCRHCHRLIHTSAREHDARVDELSCDLKKMSEIVRNPSSPHWEFFLASKALRRATKHPRRCLKRIYRDARQGRISCERACELVY